MSGTKPFLDEDFLLTTETARTLYHTVAEQMPILDYHCAAENETRRDDENQDQAIPRYAASSVPPAH